jgi:hypothetical protein
MGMGYYNFEATRGRSAHRPEAGIFEAPSTRQRGDALNDNTYFTLFARWPGEVRLFTVEWELIQTEAEALSAVKETENAVLVFRNDPDVPRADVSEDIARLFVKDLLARGFNLEAIDFPSFVLEHLSPADIALVDGAAKAPRNPGDGEAPRGRPWFPGA